MNRSEDIPQYIACLLSNLIGLHCLENMPCYRLTAVREATLGEGEKSFAEDVVVINELRADTEEGLAIWR